MAIALSAIVFFALAAPGFIAWYGFRTDQQVASSVHGWPPIDTVFKCSILSIFLQFAWIPVAERIGKLCGSDCSINVAEAINLIAGKYSEDRPLNLIAEDLAKFRMEIMLYLLGLYAASFAVGWLSRLVIVYWNLDRYAIFQSWPWHELFYRARDREAGKGSKAFTWVTFVTDTSAGNFLYRGALRRYFLNSKRELDRIELYAVSRRRLPDDATAATREIDDYNAGRHEEEFYSIDVDYFVVKMDAVKNLAVFYLDVTPIAGGSASIAATPGPVAPTSSPATPSAVSVGKSAPQPKGSKKKRK